MMTSTETIALNKPAILRGAAIGLVGSLLGVALLIPVGLYLLLIGYVPESLVRRVEPALNEYLYLSATHFSNIARLFDSRSAIEFTDTHIVDNASAACAGRIAWADVERMERAGFGKHEGVTLFVQNPDSVLGEARGLRRALLRLNNAIYLSPIHVSCDCIGISSDELLATLRSWQESATGRPLVNTAPDERYLVPYVESPTAGTGWSTK